MTHNTPIIPNNKVIIPDNNNIIPYNVFTYILQWAYMLQYHDIPFIIYDFRMPVILINLRNDCIANFNIGQLVRHKLGFKLSRYDFLESGLMILSRSVRNRLQLGIIYTLVNL